MQQVYKLIKKNYIPISLIALALVIFSTVTYAWYYDRNYIELTKFDGAVTYLAKYFESGDGASPAHATRNPDGSIANEAGCAYEIHTPEQLYNLAWLQYMGYFNQSEDGSTIPTTYFYLSADLDMSGYTLPPIGTADYPFIGNFDGCGHTISNLNVSNSTTLGDNPVNDLPYTLKINGTDTINGVNIVGLFGVVGALDNAPGSIGSYTYSSQTNEIKNFNINAVTVSTQLDQSLIGIAAGYVNGTVKNVGVSDSQIKVGTDSAALSEYTSNLSDYSLVGYCTEAYRGMAGVAKRELIGPDETDPVPADPSEVGLGSAWGDSIAMETMYTNLASLKNNAVTAPIISEDVTVITAQDGNQTVTSNITRGNGTLGQRNRYNLVNYYGDNGGVSATFVNRTDTNNYLYLTEAADNVKKNVTTTEYKASSEIVFSDASGNYIGVAADGTVDISNWGNARAWTRNPDNANDFYYIENDTRFYLNCDDDGNLYVSDAKVTLWTIGKDTISCVQNGVRKYLYCDTDNNKWTVAAQVRQFYITDGDGNFLSVSSAAVPAIINADQNTASSWNSKEGKISINTNGNLYYLNYDAGTGELALSDEQLTEWINDGASIYCMVDGTPYYLAYTDGKWNAEHPLDAIRKIYNGSNYLSIDSNGALINVSNEAAASEWMFTYNNGSYLISTALNEGTDAETRWYLTSDDWTGTVVIAEGSNQVLKTTDNPANAINWKWDEDVVEGNLIGTIYYTRNNNADAAPVRFLEWSGSQWQITAPKVYYTISKTGTDMVTNYLRYTNAIDNTDDPGKATWWDFSNHDNITSPNGTVKIKDSTQQYLTYTRGLFSRTLTVNNNSTTWTSDGTSLRTGDYYYVKYNNGWEMSGWLRRANVDIKPIQERHNASLKEILLSPPEAFSLDTNGIPSINISSAQTGDRGTESNSSPLAATTYFPLSTMGSFPYAASPANTGYVISGKNDTSSAYQADIRVSRYGIGNISTSTLSNNRYNGETVKILACSKATNGEFKVISGDGTGLNVGGTNYAYQADMGFTKYEAAKRNLDALLNGKSYIYGLHFMNAQISNDNKLTATKATINGKTYANYELPKDCIDVNLAYDGYITLFAGTYYSGNNTFFSIYKITRDSDNNITKITPYKGKESFDMSWITNSQSSKDDDDDNTGFVAQRKKLENNALYYFEIPVDAGEYAIGSVKGMTGAYLIYLDLSANQRNLYETTVTQEDKLSTSLYEYPMGVDIVEPGKPVGVTPSAVVSIPAGSAGSMTLKRTDAHTVSYTPIGDEEMVSTYTAHLNTYNTTDALPVDRTLSVYGTADDFGNLDDFLSWDESKRITEKNQYIDADVELVSPTVTATPAAEITLTTITTYKNYYSIEIKEANEKRVLISSTAENPKIEEKVTIIPDVSTSAEISLAAEYDAPPAKARMLSSKPQYTYVPVTMASADEEAGGGGGSDDGIALMALSDDEASPDAELMSAEPLVIELAPEILEASRNTYRSYQMQPERHPLPDYISLAPVYIPEPETYEISQEDILALDTALSEISDEDIALGLAEEYSDEYSDEINEMFTDAEPQLLARIIHRLMLIQDENLRQDAIDYLWNMAEGHEDAQNALLCAVEFLPEEEAASFLPKDETEALSPEEPDEALMQVEPAAVHTLYAKQTTVFFNGAAEMSIAAYDLPLHSSIDVFRGCPLLSSDMRLPAADIGSSVYGLNSPAPLIYLNSTEIQRQKAWISIRCIGGELAFDKGDGNLCTLAELDGVQIIADDYGYTALIPANIDNIRRAAYCAIDDSAAIVDAVNPFMYVLIPTCAGGAANVERIELVSTNTLIGAVELPYAVDVLMNIQTFQNAFESISLHLDEQDGQLTLITDFPDNLIVTAMCEYTVLTPEMLDKEEEEEEEEETDEEEKDEKSEENEDEEVENDEKSDDNINDTLPENKDCETKLPAESDTSSKTEPVTGPEATTKPETTNEPEPAPEPQTTNEPEPTLLPEPEIIPEPAPGADAGADMSAEITEENQA